MCPRLHWQLSQDFWLTDNSYRPLSRICVFTNNRLSIKSTTELWMLWVQKGTVLFEMLIFTLTFFSLLANSPFFLRMINVCLYCWVSTYLCSSSRSRKKFPWDNLPNRHFLSWLYDLFSFCHPNPMWYFSKWYHKSSFHSCVDSVKKERLPKIKDFSHLTAIV